MKQILVRGTLGDAYTVGLKIKEDVEILHYTIHKQWYNEIRQIYEFFPRIKKVDFVEYLFPDAKEISGVPEESMIWFPEAGKDIINKEDIGFLYESYIVISAHGGREDAMARKIPIIKIERMIEIVSPIPVVLVGTDLKYKDIKCELNLIGETEIEDVFELIRHSSGFCGPEGFPCFVALSHKIPSVVFYVRYQPVEARILQTPWQEFIIDLIKID